MSLKKLIGKVAIIKFKKGSNGSVLNEFKGIIANVSIQQEDAYHSKIVLSGYSPTIVLDSGPHTVCFIKKDLKKIVTEVLIDASAECKINVNPNSTKTIEYFTQYNESNFEFLNRISAEFGESFFYNGKEIFFGRLPNSKNVEMIVGEDITSIQMHLQLMPSLTKTFAYNPVTNNLSTGTSPKQVDVSPNSKHALDESDKLFSKTVQPFIRPAVEMQADLEAAMKTHRTSVATQLEVISGRSVNVEISPGVVATLKISQKLDRSFSLQEFGKYLITTVSHNLAEDGNYTNSFEGLPSSVANVPAKELKKARAESQLGTVTANNDPNKIGRVKVNMPWQANGITTDWLRVISPSAGGGRKSSTNRGFVFVPEVGDQVMVGFKHDDPDKPYVMGSLFHGKNGAGGGDKNSIKSLSSNSGNIITLDDEKGSLKIEDAKGNSIFLDGGGKIAVTCSEQIDLKTGDSSITLKKDGSIVISGKVKVDVQSDQAVNIEGKTEVLVKGTNVSAKADGTLDLSGISVSAKATTSLALEGTATAKLSSSAMVELSAALVKIN